MPKDRRVQGAVDLPLAAVPAMAAIMAAPISALRDSRAEVATSKAYCGSFNLQSTLLSSNLIFRNRIAEHLF